VLQGLDGDIKSAFLHNISILVAQVAADGKLTWSDGVYILEWYYQNVDKAAA
jgi:ferric iron reductase protein FhuF